MYGTETKYTIETKPSFLICAVTVAMATLNPQQDSWKLKICLQTYFQMLTYLLVK